MNKDLVKPPAPGTAPRMSENDFAQWGLAEVAYVKPIQLDGATVFGVFAANGQRIGVMRDADVARVAVRQNDLEPMSVH